MREEERKYFLSVKIRLCEQIEGKIVAQPHLPDADNCGYYLSAF
jgi:hypothetical protein